MSHNQRFLNHASRVIQDDPSHPLRFLLNNHDRVMTLQSGNINVFDQKENAIYSGSSGKLVSELNPNQIASELGVSVSCDACHLTTKKHGAEERLALGIAEDNRSNGRVERSIEICNEAISIGGLPVIKESAEKWEEFGLLKKGTVDSSMPDLGWSSAGERKDTPEAFWQSARADAKSRQGQFTQPERKPIDSLMSDFTEKTTEERKDCPEVFWQSARTDSKIRESQSNQAERKLIDSSLSDMKENSIDYRKDCL
jgi:hypothetical protein